MRASYHFLWGDPAGVSDVHWTSLGVTQEDDDSTPWVVTVVRAGPNIVEMTP